MARTQRSIAAGALVLFFCGCGTLGPQKEAQTFVVRKPTPDEVAQAVSSLSRDPKTASKLKSLENRMTSSKEIEQYSKALPYMTSDLEKMEFLGLEGFEERQLWLSQKNFPTRPTESAKSLQELVDARDISLGMPQKLVKRSWGDPDSVEVSGNPRFKNERWVYETNVSTPDGYRLEKKSVYFEGGKVVGWEVE
jgi:hypothetical protein